MKDSKDNNDLALKYHSSGRPGKIEVQSTKPTLTANDLSLAYSPGVASPCLEIAKNPEDAYKYTTKGNLVGVVSNGSAVLGLGKYHVHLRLVLGPHGVEPLGIGHDPVEPRLREELLVDQLQEDVDVSLVARLGALPVGEGDLVTLKGFFENAHVTR